jgi:hypothetical protein
MRKLLTSLLLVAACDAPSGSDDEALSSGPEGNGKTDEVCESGPCPEPEGPQLIVDTFEAVSVVDAQSLEEVLAAGDPDLRVPEQHHVGCAPLAELDRTYLCVFNHRRTMNATLLRASMHAEALYGHDRSMLPPRDHDELRRNADIAAGHNLWGTDLAAFAEQAGPCASAEDKHCLGRLETTFFSEFLAEIDDPNSIVLGVSMFSNFGFSKPAWDGVFAHELRHALYFGFDGYAQTVRDFLDNEVTAQDRAAIEQNLATTYGIDHVERLSYDEFQAYLLGVDAQTGRLRDFVGIYAQPLRDRLAAVPDPAMQDAVALVEQVTAAIEQGP